MWYYNSVVNNKHMKRRIRHGKLAHTYTITEELMIGIITAQTL